MKIFHDDTRPLLRAKECKNNGNPGPTEDWMMDLTQNQPTMAVKTSAFGISKIRCVQGEEEGERGGGLQSCRSDTAAVCWRERQWSMSPGLYFTSAPSSFRLSTGSWKVLKAPEKSKDMTLTSLPSLSRWRGIWAARR